MKEKKGMNKIAIINHRGVSMIGSVFSHSYSYKH